jgi:hypothetical protein
MKRKTIAGLIAIAAIVAVVIFTGCVGKYSVDSAVAEGYLDVDVSGPAEDLAVILTNPEGYTDIEYISKEEMIDNFESVNVRMSKGRSPPAGTYKLVVKTVTPEKVVYKTEMKFKPAIVRITDAEVKFVYEGGRGALGTYYRLYGDSSITVKNDGELPVVLREARYNVDGKEIGRTIYKGLLCSGEIKNINDYWYVDGGQQKPSMPNHVKIVLYSSEGEIVASSVA